MEARKTCHGVVQTSIWSITDSAELCNKNYIVQLVTNFNAILGKIGHTASEEVIIQLFKSVYQYCFMV